MLVVLLALIDDAEDKEKFASLYIDYKDAMRLYALGILHDEGLAEDAVHDAFERVALNFQKIDFSRNPRNLLITIVKNVALTKKQKMKREMLTVDLARESFVPDKMNLEEHAENCSELENVAKIVSTMPEGYLLVYRLRCIYDMSFSQIGAALGISAATARKRFQRVRERIIRANTEEQQ